MVLSWGRRGIQLIVDKTALLITVLIVLVIIAVTAIRLHFG
jgi:Tfp pilus assembly protein PilX